MSPAPPPHTLRVLIVDDEPLARQLVRERLLPHTDVEVVGECANGFEAVEAALRLDPDLLFLDIQMPKMSGFEVLELIGPRVAVIFVTAYDSYAVRAFEVHAVDYLLKPFSSDRFEAALDRARKRVGRGRAVSPFRLGSDARPEGSPAERIVIREGGRVVFIPVEKLDWAKAEDDYVSLHTGGREILKQQTLVELESSLDAARFVRIHRSYVIRVAALDRLENNAAGGWVAVMRDGSRLSVSRAGGVRLRKVLGMS